MNAKSNDPTCAAEIMWNRTCGLLPIVNAEGKGTGGVTDRDLFIALGTRNKLPGELTDGRRGYHGKSVLLQSG